MPEHQNFSKSEPQNFSKSEPQNFSKNYFFSKKKLKKSKKIFIQIHHKKSIWTTFEHVFKNRGFEHQSACITLRKTVNSSSDDRENCWVDVTGHAESIPHIFKAIRLRNSWQIYIQPLMSRALLVIQLSERCVFVVHAVVVHSERFVTLQHTINPFLSNTIYCLWYTLYSIIIIIYHSKILHS